MPTGITVQQNLAQFNLLIRELPDKLDDAGRGLAQQFTNDIVISVSEAGPSEPGEPPGVDTGALRGGMHWEPVGNLTYHSGDSVEYGLHLELGTERMAARPFMTPMLEHYRQGEAYRFFLDFGIV